MKKTVAVLSALALVATFDAKTVRAIETPRQDRVEARKEVMIENAENRQEFRQERRDTVLENIASRVETRFARHEERLQNWIDRATAHSDKMAAAGKDNSDVVTALATAKASLASASQLGDDAVAKLRAVTPEAWAEQKADALAAKEAVRKAQVAYAQVVKDMKQVVVELKKVVSSTE